MARRIIARSASVTSPTKLTSSASCWASKRRGYVENGLCLCEQECQPPASATGGLTLAYFFPTPAQELHPATSQFPGIALRAADYRAAVVTRRRNHARHGV